MFEYRMCLSYQLRQRYGISQTELARAARVSRQLIGQIELDAFRQTRGHEAMLRKAFAAVIAIRRQEMDALERDLADIPWLFSISKEDNQNGP